MPAKPVTSRPDHIIENISQEQIPEFTRDVGMIADILELCGVSNPTHEQTLVPSRPVNKINIPEIKNEKGRFVYNYFTPDERVRSDSLDPNQRLVNLDSGNTEEIFHRIRNKKIARFIEIQFAPPSTLGEEITGISLANLVASTTESTFPLNNPTAAASAYTPADAFTYTEGDVDTIVSKIVAEGTYSTNIFSGVELIDTGKENTLYKMLNGALFFSNIPQEKLSNRQKISKLNDTLTEKGGLKGQDKKILFEAFRNFTPNVTSDSSNYVLASSDVDPETAEFASDPIGKQTFSVQFNNLLMVDVLRESSQLSDSIYQDEIQALLPRSVEIRENIEGTISPSNTYQPAEYSLEVPAVDLVPFFGDEQAMSIYPKITFTGYLVEKFEVFPDGGMKFCGRKLSFGKSNTNFIDNNVRYGGAYFYKIRTVCKIQAVVDTVTTDPASAQAALATVYMASEGKIINVLCVERVPPPPPNILHTTFEFKTLLPKLRWNFPLNKQRDIKRFQIFKRLSIDEPFVLLKEYDFDNSEIRTQVAEIAQQGNLIENPGSVLNFIDTTHNEGEKPIYAIACVDAHGLSSNYGPQIKVERDRYTNRVKRTLISRPGAPKPYPNLYLRRDTFQDAIKTSGYDRIKLIFDPEYYRVVREVQHSGGLVEERDLNFLAIDDIPEPSFRYNFHFINVDNQKDQLVKVRIINNAAPGALGDNTFAVPAAAFSNNNLSFQYGTE